MDEIQYVVLWVIDLFLDFDFVVFVLFFDDFVIIQVVVVVWFVVVCKDVGVVVVGIYQVVVVMQ